MHALDYVLTKEEKKTLKKKCVTTLTPQKIRFLIVMNYVCMDLLKRTIPPKPMTLMLLFLTVRTISLWIIGVI